MGDREPLPDPPIDHFDLLAPLYERFISIPDATTLIRLTQPDPALGLLDVGGGTGRVTQHFRGLARFACILDLSTGMLEEALGKGGLCGCQGVAGALPFRDGAFARVVAVDSFHHFRDHTRAAAELLRVLAPGGRLVIEEPDLRRFIVKLVALGERLALMRSRFYKPAALMRFFTSEATRVSLHTDDSPNIWVVVEKSPY
jgi:demethylmenaquinone methyltransferase/2-methoxy-6-polyprenyl-1,4-benzoquinol methylase